VITECRLFGSQLIDIVGVYKCWPTLCYVSWRLCQCAWQSYVPPAPLFNYTYLSAPPHLKALQQSMAFLRALEENAPSGKCFVDLMLDDILASGCRNLPVDIIESLRSDVWKSKNHSKHPFLLYPGLKHIPKHIRFELWFLPQFRPWCCVPI